MTTPKASGPLWVNRYGDQIDITTVSHDQQRFAWMSNCEAIPCRLIPGHGKVVPLEAVEAVRAHILKGTKWTEGEVVAMLDAAIKGAV